MRKLFRCCTIFLACTPAAADTVDVSGGSASDPVVYVDGKYVDCDNDTLFHAPPPVDIGNADSDSACTGEVVVFSDDRAVAILQDPPLTPGNDSITVPLQASWSVPVRFVIFASEVLPDPTKAVLMSAYTAQVVEADLHFAASHAGIDFQPPDFAWVENAAAAQELASAAEAAWSGDLEGAEFVSAVSNYATIASDTINVIVVETNLITGIHVRNSDGSSTGVVALGALSTNSTLAHEVGHAFSLDHVNFMGRDKVTNQLGEYCVAFGDHARYDGDCDYAERNIMWAGFSGPRNRLTHGQAFRVSVNSRSFLNDSQTPIRPDTEVTRDCPDWRFDRECPYLSLSEEAP